MALVRSAVALTLLAALAAPTRARAGEPAKHMAPAAETPSPDFDRLRSLAGEWEGTAREGADPKILATRATIKVVSAGSAVMLVTDRARRTRWSPCSTGTARRCWRPTTVPP